MYDIRCKLNHISSIFSLTRNFSYKISSHLKILCHLVNGLVESDDNLEIEDIKLALPEDYAF